MVRAGTGAPGLRWAPQPFGRSAAPHGKDSAWWADSRVDSRVDSRAGRDRRPVLG